VFGLLELDTVDHGSIQAHLDPEKAKINSAETHRFVSNAVEIDNRLGNDETDWLFDTDTP
jgi:hypothetical protein